MKTHILALALVAGCTLSNLTPQARFNNAANDLNEAARWGQVDMAAQHVSATYRPRFLARRSAWGEHINIAEVEFVGMQLDDDHEHAISEVTLSWYDPSGVILRKSSIVQRWESERGRYRLVDETLKRGDPGVFAEVGKR